MDGLVIPEQPFDYMADGGVEIPILLGTVRDDALLFIYQATEKPLSVVKYALAVGYIFNLEATAVLEYYTAPLDSNDTRPLLGELGTDYIFLCSNRCISNWTMRITLFKMQQRE